MRLILAAVVLAMAPICAAAQSQTGWTLNAPAEAVAGEVVMVEWQSDLYAGGDYLDIAPVGLPGTQGYLTFAYANPQRAPVALATPAEPGTYELRYIQAGAPAPVRARRLIVLTATEASLSAPDRVGPGDAFLVQWQGPFNPANWITLTRPDRPDDHFLDGYVYVTADRAPVVLNAPLQPGTYELRMVLYGTTGSQPVVARRPLVVAAGPVRP